MKRSRLVLGVGALWFMAQAFRFAARRGECFGPGAGRLLRYELGRLRHALYDHDRLRWRQLRLRAMFRRKGGG